MPLSLGDVFMEKESLCEPFERCGQVCEYMLDRAPIWLDEVLYDHRVRPEDLIALFDDLATELAIASTGTRLG